MTKASLGIWHAACKTWICSGETSGRRNTRCDGLPFFADSANAGYLPFIGKTSFRLTLRLFMIRDNM